MVGPIYALERQRIKSLYPNFDSLLEPQQQAILNEVRRELARQEQQRKDKRAQQVRFAQDLRRELKQQGLLPQAPMQTTKKEPKKPPIPKETRPPNQKPRRPKLRRSTKARKKSHW